MTNSTATKIDQETLRHRCDLILERGWSPQEIRDWVNILHPDNRQDASRWLGLHAAEAVNQPEQTHYRPYRHNPPGVNAMNRWSYEGLTPRHRASSDETDAERKRAIWQWIDEGGQ
ncbi:hypothetical protein [Aeromonas sp. HMWF016]|uniref:hypothetical protein n=1 Tax=Aeromonas TaxID=642 RepID=UPI0011B26279|nr:hypothetical protein [Aeromonas sp. HMWF016]